jgi:hypothetical protein
MSHSDAFRPARPPPGKDRIYDEKEQQAVGIIGLSSYIVKLHCSAAGAARVLAQQCEIGAIVVVAEEDGLPPISLGPMMGHGGNDDAGQVRHEATVVVDDETVKLVLCPYISNGFDLSGR